MSSESDGRNIATTASGHKVVAGPELSNNPPTPPAGPIPVPYVIAASSSTATSTGEKLIVKGAEVLHIDSAMDADPPANAPSKATGGDVVTFAVRGSVPVTSATDTTTVSGKSVVRTGDTAAVNTASDDAEFPQMTGILVDGAGVIAGAANASKAAGGDGDTAAAKAAQGSEEEEAPAAANAPAAPECDLDPIAVVSGDVLDSDVDLTLPGAIALSWSRHYSSQRHQQRGMLGCGGWTLGMEQWVRPGRDPQGRPRLEVSLRDGRTAYFAPIGAGEQSFNRQERLELFADKDGRYRLWDLSSRQWRDFAPQPPQQPNAVARLVAIWDEARRGCIRLDYDGERLVRVVDTAYRELRLSHGEQGFVARLEVWARPPRTQDEIAAGTPAAEPSLQTWIDYAYDADDCLASVTDALGCADRYAYDIARRRVRYTMKNGQSFHYEYDEQGRCVRGWGDDGLHSGDFARKTGSDGTVQVHTSGHPEPRRYVGDADGYLLLEETLDGSLQRKNEYDDDHLLLSESNAAGHKTVFCYDERANRLSLTDPAGNETQYGYDVDRLVSRTSPEGHQTQYAYDDSGNLVTAQYPTGEAYQLSYEQHGLVTAIYGPGVSGGGGASFGFAYDEHHNLVEESDSRGARTRYRYDALGRPVERIDTFDRVTKVTYDQLGRARHVTHADGSVTQADYDELGNIARYVDPLGHETTMRYAGTGVLVELCEPEVSGRGRQKWRFVYDKRERLRKIINPRSETYEYHYDAAGRVVEERPFDGRVLRYRYDKGERLSRISRPDGSWRSFHYDELSNVVLERSSDGGIVYQRDELGRLLEAVVQDPDGDVVTRFERDAFGRLLAEEQDGQRIEYVLDEQGRRAERRLPEAAGSARTQYRYDAFGAFSEVVHDGADHDPVSVQVSRDALGRQTQRRFADHVDEQRHYDLMDRLIDQTVQKPGLHGAPPAEVVSRSWGYDRAGRPTSITDGRWGRTDYAYDPLGQLLAAKSNRQHEVFDYDVTGSLQNVLSGLESPERSKPWNLQKGNVLVEKDGTQYENDACKRRTRKVEPDGSVTRYQWDCRDRLRSVVLPDGRLVEFTYDAFARRVRKVVTDAPKLPLAEALREALQHGAAEQKVTTTRFLWDGDVLCAELGEAGARVHVHEPGSFVPLLQAEGGAVYSVVTDHLGMPKELLDASGKVAWAAAHSAWGRVVEVQRDAGAAQVESPFRLLGQYHDEETGLAYTRFRYFDAEAGRWCSPDPLGIWAGRNLLGFGGSPNAVVDPLGLACEQKRGPDGKFLPKNAGEVQPGQTAVENMVAHLQANGVDVVATEVYVQTPFGLRRHDIVVRGPDGQLHAIEVKSTDGAFKRTNTQQNAADEWLRRQGGLPAHGKSAREAGIETQPIVSVTKMQW